MKPNRLPRLRVLSWPCAAGSLIAILMLAAPSVARSQRIWTVDNRSGHDADFDNLQAAHDAAENGDVVYVAPSQTAYEGMTLVKRLTVIGPGYFLKENGQPVDTYAEASVGGFSFSSDPGGGFEDPTSSDGSTCIGLHFANGLDVANKNITLNRCRFSGGIGVASGSDGLTLTQCYCESHFYGPRNSTIVATDNILAANNFIGGIVRIGGDCNGVVFQHNIVGSELHVGTPDSVVTNNILLFSDPAGFGVDGIFQANMLAAPAEFLPPGNFNRVNPVTVFVGDASPSLDGRWQLKEDSPAIGAGLLEEDLGIFGGATPYVLSGLPPIPKLRVDTSPSGTDVQGLKVRITVESQN